MAIEYRYGRLLSDFEKGATYEHPWEVTVDGGTIALFQASFLDAAPMFASATLARAYGFRDRPLHPLLCLNLALSFSVHDVSEQAIAHLAYIDVRFPEAGYAGDTVRARSTVLDAKPASSGDKGVVHVRTVLLNEHDKVLCAFERKALIRAGKLESRPPSPAAVGGGGLAGGAIPALGGLERLPAELRVSRMRHYVREGFAGWFEDFEKDQVFTHAIGKTIGESEHMQMTALVRNSHPLHFDEVYCKDNSFTKQRVVYGGLVLSWVATLASRDVCGNALWELGYDAGAHPNGVVGGDTLYAASKVLEVKPLGAGGEVTFRLVGVKNKTSAQAFAEHGDALFSEELPKKENKIKEKVVEITRTIYVRRRP
jgi:2-methylfumaryl-CoA hydratase